MGDLFFRSLKAFIFCACIIGGIGTFVAVEEGNIKPLIISVFSFGGAYLMSAVWRGIQSKGAVSAVAMVVVGAIVAQHLPAFAYASFGYEIYLNYYFIWMGLMLFPGIPILMFIFKNFSE